MKRNRRAQKEHKGRPQLVLALTTVRGIEEGQATSDSKYT